MASRRNPNPRRTGTSVRADGDDFDPALAASSLLEDTLRVEAVAAMAQANLEHLPWVKDPDRARGLDRLSALVGLTVELAGTTLLHAQDLHRRLDALQAARITLRSSQAK